MSSGRTFYKHGIIEENIDLSATSSFSPFSVPKRSDREQPQRPCLKEKPMLSSAFLLKTPDSLLKARTRQTVRDILETLVRGSLRVTGYSRPSFSERRKRL